LEAEHIDRFWKALRLAAAIALIEPPNDLTIQLEDYKVAVFLTEKWGSQFQVFLKEKTQPIYEEVYNFILNNPKCSKMDLRKIANIGTNGNTKGKMDTVLSVVSEMADESNMKYIVDSGKGTAKYYSIIPYHLIDIEENQRNQKGFSSVDISELSF
jgi:hypothetical protein